jgi:hypothetical protein
MGITLCIYFPVRMTALPSKNSDETPFPHSLLDPTDQGSRTAYRDSAYTPWDLWNQYGTGRYFPQVRREIVIPVYYLVAYKPAFFPCRGVFTSGILRFLQV